MFQQKTLFLTLLSLNTINPLFGVIVHAERLTYTTPEGVQQEICLLGDRHVQEPEIDKQQLDVVQKTVVDYASTLELPLQVMPEYTRPIREVVQEPDVFIHLADRLRRIRNISIVDTEIRIASGVALSILKREQPCILDPIRRVTDLLPANYADVLPLPSVYSIPFDFCAMKYNDIRFSHVHDEYKGNLLKAKQDLLELNMPLAEKELSPEFYDCDLNYSQFEESCKEYACTPRDTISGKSMDFFAYQNSVARSELYNFISGFSTSLFNIHLAIKFLTRAQYKNFLIVSGALHTQFMSSYLKRLGAQVKFSHEEPYSTFLSSEGPIPAQYLSGIFTSTEITPKPEPQKHYCLVQ